MRLYSVDSILRNCRLPFSLFLPGSPFSFSSRPPFSLFLPGSPAPAAKNGCNSRKSEEQLEGTRCSRVKRLDGRYRRLLPRLKQTSNIDNRRVSFFQTRRCEASSTCRQRSFFYLNISRALALKRRNLTIPTVTAPPRRP